MWEDAPMTVYSRELADWDGSGYGALVTCPSVSPLSLPFLALSSTSLALTQAALELELLCTCTCV
jgi:hypothetical protein